MTVSQFEYAGKPKTEQRDLASTSELKTTPGPLPPILDGLPLTERTNNSEQYIYQYGIKNMGLSHSLYEQAGIFVTKPIEIEGNIIEVSLDAIEEHPLFDELNGMATDRLTSIEYYVSLEENPSQNDWFPILPEGVMEIKCEKLFFQGSSADLRFIADIHDEKNTKVYKNNILMKTEDWYFIERGAAIQLAVPYNSNSIYTIDYVPDTALFNPWVVQVGDRYSKRVRKIDTFPGGTDYNQSIKLSKYPYINYGLINQIDGYDPNTNEYRPFDVFLKDGTIAIGDGQVQKDFFPAAYANGSEFQTLNRTNYKVAKDVFLNKYNIIPETRYRVFEYKQEKNKLIFTESFNRSDLYYNEASNHGNATLEVHYDYLVTNFRLKIILRKNTGDELVVTPLVDSYQLKFKVMK